MKLSTDTPQKNSGPISKRLGPWLPMAVLFLSAALLQGCARLCPGFGQWYARHIYPLLLNTLGRLTGLLPFSAAELGLYLLAVSALLNLFFHRKRPCLLLRRFLTAAALFAFLFTAGCGVNYYRQPFSYTCGLTVRPSSTDELYRLCQALTDQISLAAKKLDQAAPGLAGQTQPAKLSFRQLRYYGQASRQAMKGLGEEFSDLSGFYPMPKPLLVSSILSVQQLCGIYSPFTVEANYNRDMPLYNIPHTICHELSHLKGFMREDEANFIGYMACIRSDDPVFNYSGYLMGWVYAGNALAAADWDAYMELRDRLPQKALTDLAYNNAFWDSYDSKVAQAATKVNDTYLKLQDQEDGVKSYGRVVDLMLAYYRKHPLE